MTRFEAWLLLATDGLGEDAVARIHAEITGRYQAALDSGHTPEAAFASLGDPRAANREYRRVRSLEDWLTEYRRGTSLEAWLTAATNGLSDDAVARIHAEITDHFQAALDSGSTPEEALAALGDPKQARKQYGKVFLTVREAHTLGEPRFFLGELSSFLGRLIVALLSTQPWVLLTAGSVPLVFQHFLPAINATRARNYFFASLAQTAVAYFLGLLSFWWIVLLLLPENIRTYQRWRSCRKLQSTAPSKVQAAIAAYGRQLDDLDKGFLRRWERQPTSRFMGAVLVLLLAASAVFAWVRPWSGVPFALFVAFTYGLPHLVRIGTPARGQSFRRIKWILLAAAGVSLSVETLWAPQILKTTTAESFYTVEGMIGMEIVILYPILWFETYREGLRRKLPIEQWPERLYR